MEIKTKIEGKEVFFFVSGRIDAATREEFHSAVAEVSFEGKSVTFDFSDVTYISSAGLREVLIARKKSPSGDVCIVNLSEEVYDIFQMTGFSGMISVSRKEEESSQLPHASFKEILKIRASSPENVFLCTDDATYTWGEMEQCAQIMAMDLFRLGVRRGTHVGIIGTNSANWMLAFFAIQKLGAIACLINSAWKTDEVRKAVQIGDITHICRGEVADESMDFGNGVTVYDIREEQKLKERLSEYPSVEGLFDGTVEADDACVMIYTSGSTGTPKGVLLSAYNILIASELITAALRLEKTDRLCLILPLFHIFGLTAGFFCNVQSGGSIFIPKNIRTQTILEAVEKEECTLLHSVPTMVLALMNNPAFDGTKIASLRTIMLAGAKLTEAQALAMQKSFPNVQFIGAYGLSEMVPVSMTAYGEPFSYLYKTVGKPVEDMDIQIRDTKDGHVCREGEVGEILVDGTSLMSCYYKEHPDKQSIDEEGWLHTGDLGLLDSEGYLHIEGRIKDTIIRGGENIMPEEVAEVISAFPDVQDVKVCGVSHSFLGETVCALLVMKNGKSFDEAAMRAFLADRLSKQKIPDYFDVYSEFPMLANGKVDARSLREAAEKKFGS